VNDGTDKESDEFYRQRIRDAKQARFNPGTLASQLTDVPGIRSAFVIDDPSLGGEITCIIDPVNLPMSQFIYNLTLETLNEIKVAGIITTSVIRLKKGSGTYDIFPVPYINVPDIIWVADGEDGSSPYTAGTNYVVYVDGDDRIEWITGGPSTGDHYHVKLAGVIRPADSITVDIDLRVKLYEDENIDTLAVDIASLFDSFLRGKTMDDDLRVSEVSELINKIESIKYTDDIIFSTILQIKRDATYVYDIIQSEQVVSSSWANEEPDQSGTSWSPHTEYDILTDVFTIQHDGTGAPTAVVLRITENRLQTYVDGVLDLDYDLNDPLYDNVSELRNDIVTNNYTCTLIAASNVASKRLFPVENIGILSSGYTTEGRGILDWTKTISGNRPTDKLYYSIQTDTAGDIGVRQFEIMRAGSVTITEIGDDTP
jgi:hypothetical protein